MMRSFSWRMLRQREMLVEFRLAEQHDLQQLVPVRLEVGEQPDLLQRLDRHRVRLVDQHHDAPARGVELDQVLLQRAQQDRSTRSPRDSTCSSSAMACRISSRDSDGLAR